MQPAQLYLIVGLVSIISYLILFLTLKEQDRRCSPTLDERLLLLEYENLNEEVRRRGDTLATHGSIFVVASLLLLGYATSTSGLAKEVIVWISLSVYIVWLFPVTYGTMKLDNVALARLRGIEEQQGFEVHCYMKKEKDNNLWLKRSVNLRRFIWGFVLIVLVLGGFFLLN